MPLSAGFLSVGHVPSHAPFSDQIEVESSTSTAHGGDYIALPLDSSDGENIKISYITGHLSLFGLLQQNTTDRVPYKEQKFTAHGSRGLTSIMVGCW